MNIYLLPGLGFDNRIYQNIDFGKNKTIPINWIEPQTNESIQSYAKRLSQNIDDTKGRVVLIGHSLGGILSQEIATIKNIDTIILISSIQSREELPMHFKMMAPLYLHKLFSKELTFSSFWLWAKNHDYVSAEEQDLFKDMIAKQTNTYLQWALYQLSIWKTPNVPKTTNIIQLHGQRDKTFPVHLVKNPYETIEEGGHFMVYKHAPLISELLREVLI